jgi:murein DD-endopeptidase MepM/ murein hydrolase activator NlpD
MALVICWLRQYHQAKEPPSHFSINTSDNHEKKNMNRTFNILLIVGCVLSIAAAFVISVKPSGTPTAPTSQIETNLSPSLPTLGSTILDRPVNSGIARRLQLKTDIPDRSYNKMIQYRVQPGDSPWSIAQKFGIQPETILWANERLNTMAGNLKIGDTVNILPVDGVLHTVQDGDTIEALVRLHETPAQEILEYFGNNFDLTKPPQLIIGQQITIPNGVAPISWSEAQIPSVAQGGSRGSSSGNVPNLGSGYFIWPVNGYVLTQGYWSGHPAIDLATDFRQPIFASDSGTVIFSGWDTTGYGNFIAIDHGNGFKTTYGHNEANLVGTGQTVVKGQQIAESGNTGNSTGNHIDFRILLNGTFVNPLGYLP